MKDCRKPCMKELKNFPMARCGSMTQETAKAMKSADVAREKLVNGLGNRKANVREMQYREWQRTGEWKHSSSY
jgi:hypothetical protein